MRHGAEIEDGWEEEGRGRLQGKHERDGKLTDNDAHDAPRQLTESRIYNVLDAE